MVPQRSPLFALLSFTYPRTNLTRGPARRWQAPAPCAVASAVVRWVNRSCRAPLALSAILELSAVPELVNRPVSRRVIAPWASHATLLKPDSVFVSLGGFFGRVGRQNPPLEHGRAVPLPLGLTPLRVRGDADSTHTGAVPLVRIAPSLRGSGSASPARLQILPLLLQEARSTLRKQPY